MSTAARAKAVRTTRDQKNRLNIPPSPLEVRYGRPWMVEEERKERSSKRQVIVDDNTRALLWDELLLLFPRYSRANNGRAPVHTCTECVKCYKSYIHNIAVVQTGEREK